MGVRGCLSLHAKNISYIVDMDVARQSYPERTAPRNCRRPAVGNYQQPMTREEVALGEQGIAQ